MLFAYLFLLLGLCITILLSPVIIQYEKDKEAALRLHFVFFSLSFSKSGEKTQDKVPHNSKKSKRRASMRALRSALRRALPHCTVHIRSLPLIEADSPFTTAMLTGTCFFLISLCLSCFGRCAQAPLLAESKKNSAPLNLQIKIRFRVFLHTFLVYLVQYKKEKEAKGYGRNEDERYHTHLS